MQKKILVYIASPYTHPDPVENTHKAIQAAELLLKHGCIPYVPHLTLAWNLVVPHEPAFWYAYDLHILKRCDALLRLPGESVGADREIETAITAEIPVFFSFDDLMANLIWVS